MLRTGIPYTSLDHLKMGLIRAGKACFTALSPDEQIAREMWGIVKGMAETCLENRQDIILEGCYLLPEDVAPLQGPHTQALFLTFSDRILQARPICCAAWKTSSNAGNSPCRPRRLSRCAGRRCGMRRSEVAARRPACPVRDCIGLRKRDRRGARDAVRTHWQRKSRQILKNFGGI